MYIAHNMARRLRNIKSNISFTFLVFVLLVLAGCDGTRYVADGDYLLTSARVSLREPSYHILCRGQILRNG